jgi:RNA polymerase primary sigma factor
MPAHGSASHVLHVEPRLVAAAAAGDASATARIVVSSLGLVRSTAAGYRGAGLPFEDVVQEGMIGLLDAIARYDPTRGVPFTAYARFRVRCAIRTALTESGRLVRLPKHVVARERLLAAAEARARTETGLPPTDADLAARTGLDLAAVAQIRGLAEPLSLDNPPAPGRTALAELVADRDAPDPETSALAAEQIHQLRAAVRRLPPRQRAIVDFRFGLTRPEVNAPALSRRLGRSERRIRTIEHDALYALRLTLEEQGVHG